MRSSVLNLVRNRDIFGHPITVFYKGEDAYSTFFGGMMSLVVKVLTFVLFLQAIQEIIHMEQPMVNTFENILTLEAREEIGPISLKDSGTIIAVLLMDWQTYDVSTGASMKKYKKVPMPSKFGRFIAYLNNADSEHTQLDLVDCLSVLSEE